MRTRIAVAVVSIVIYIALVEIGVRMLWVRDDAVHEAARAGIAIDTYWWTPLSLGVADGLSLPAVIIGHIPLLRQIAKAPIDRRWSANSPLHPWSACSGFGLWAQVNAYADGFALIPLWQRLHLKRLSVSRHYFSAC